MVYMDIKGFVEFKIELFILVCVVRKILKFLLNVKVGWLAILFRNLCSVFLRVLMKLLLKRFIMFLTINFFGNG